MKKELLYILIILSSYTYSQKEISVERVSDIEKLISKVLVGNCNEIFNIKFNGDIESIGYFSGGMEGLGINAGVLLSTGIANKITLNHLNNPKSKETSFNFNRTGSIDLFPFVGTHTFDACSIEFDFIPSSDTVRLKYVFASEEYPEYVGPGFNDGFGFFLEGPGIEDKILLSTIPNTDEIVSINNVNELKNPKLYVYNDSLTNISFDGFTTPLVAKHAVIQGEMYHLKIVVADGFDGVFDSGVFLEAGSFNDSENEYVTYAKNNSYFDCLEGEIEIHRAKSNDKNDTIEFDFKSDLAEGADFIIEPSKIIFKPDEYMKTIKVINLNEFSNGQKIEFSIESNDCEPSIDSLFTFPKKNYLRGTILDGEEFVRGLVKSYTINNDKSTTIIDSMIIDGDGYYELPIEHDSLYILFLPEESSNYLPSYAGGGYYPSTLNSLDINCEGFVKNIQVESKKLHGDSDKYILYSGLILNANKTTKTSVGQPNTIVYLKDNTSNQIVDYAITDKDGYFKFHIDSTVSYELSIDNSLTDYKEDLVYNQKATYVYEIVSESFIFKEETELIENTNQNENLAIYPNPILKGSNLLVQGLDNEMVYTIINTSGATVLNGKTNSNTIPTNQLKTGLYFLNVKTEQSNLSQKLIVK